MMRHQIIIAELEAVSRQRVLTDEESDRLARAIDREGRYTQRRRADRWHQDEDSVAIGLRLYGLSYPQIALHLTRRTADAVAARLNALGYRGAAG